MRLGVLVCILSSVFHCVSAQIIDTVDSHSFSNSQNIARKTDFHGFKKGTHSIMFNGNSSFVVYSKLTDVRTLNFEYFGNVTDDFNLIFSISESGKNDFQVLADETKKKIISNNAVPLSISILKFGTFDFKVQVIYTEQGSGVFALSTIRLDRYSEIEKKENQERINRELEYERKSSVIYNQKMADNYNTRVSNLLGQYKNQIIKVRDIQIKANTLSALAKTVQLVNKRTLMSDPTQYKVFSDKVKFMQRLSGPAENIYLTNIVKNFSANEINLSLNPAKKEGFKKFAMIAGDVVNLFTAGQFKGVVSSLQGLVSSIFSKGNLESKYPAYNHEINGDGKVTKTVTNKVNQDSVRILLKEGAELQGFFTSFFAKLDSNRTNFKDIIQEFQYFSLEADVFVNRVNEAHRTFYDQAKVSFSEPEYYGSIDGNFIKRLEVQVENYFDGLKIRDKVKKEEVSTHEGELSKINFLLSEIDYLDKEATRLSTRLINLFALVSEDLKTPNPFGAKDPKAPGGFKADLRYGQSFNEYQKLNKEAMDILTELEKNLEIILAQKGRINLALN